MLNIIHAFSCKIVNNLAKIKQTIKVPSFKIYQVARRIPVKTKKKHYRVCMMQTQNFADTENENSEISAFNSTPT